MGKKLSGQESYHQILSTWEQVQQKYQTTIFSLLYSDPECVLDLYFSLHPEDRDAGITLDQIKIITIEAVENYIREFAGSELFKRFLENLSAEEVVKMENYEFDMELALKVWAEEAMEKGMEKGREEAALKMLKDGKISLEKVAEYSGLSMKEVKQLAKLQTV